MPIANLTNFWFCANPHPTRVECTPDAPCSESCWWHGGRGFNHHIMEAAKNAVFQGKSPKEFYKFFGDNLEQQEEFWEKQLHLLILAKGRAYALGPDAHDYTAAVAPRFRESLEQILDNPPT